MDSLRLDGVVRLAINDDPERVITFVPDDILFAERYYKLLDDLKEKEVEYKERAKELGKNEAVDEYGIPETAKGSIALLHEACDFMRDEIDTVFGKGTSEKAFGEYRSFDMIEQLFKGITPYIQNARQKKTQKYTNPVIEKRRQIEREKAKKSK